MAGPEETRLINMVEFAQRQSLRTNPELVFCLGSLIEMECETPAGIAAKNDALQAIAPEREYGAYECPVEGCAAGLYPTGATKNIIEIDGQAYGPADTGFNRCRFIDFCLEDAWSAGADIESKPLRDAVRGGAYDYLRGECDAVTGGCTRGAHRCPRLDCDFNAGFSEDGVGGTDGVCAKKEEAPAEPLQAVESQV